VEYHRDQCLGQCCLYFFINDINDGIVPKMSKSADGTKLCRALGDEEEGV